MISLGRHFSCRMNFSNMLLSFSTRLWTYPVLFWLRRFFGFSPTWGHKWGQNNIANTSNDARWKDLSCNALRVNVTLAVREISQKSCSNVNISAAAIPDGLVRVRHNNQRLSLTNHGCISKDNKHRLQWKTYLNGLFVLAETWILTFFKVAVYAPKDFCCATF